MVWTFGTQEGTEYVTTLRWPTFTWRTQEQVLTYKKKLQRNKFSFGQITPACRAVR